MELIPRSKDGSKRARSPFTTIVVVSAIVLGASLLLGGVIAVVPRAMITGTIMAVTGLGYLAATRPASDADKVRIRSWRVSLLLYFAIQLLVVLLGLATARWGT